MILLSTRRGDPRMALAVMLQVVSLLASIVLIPGLAAADSASGPATVPVAGTPGSITIRLYPKELRLAPGGKAVVAAFTCPAADRSPFGKDRVPGTRDDACGAVRVAWSVRNPGQAHVSSAIGHTTQVTLDKPRETKLIAQTGGMERRAKILVKDGPAAVRQKANQEKQRQPARAVPPTPLTTDVPAAAVEAQPVVAAPQPEAAPAEDEANTAGSEADTAEPETQPAGSLAEPADPKAEPTEEPTQPKEVPEAEPKEVPKEEPTESKAEPAESKAEPAESAEPKESATEPKAPEEKGSEPTQESGTLADPTEEPTEAPAQTTDTPTDPTEQPPETTDIPTDPTEQPPETTEEPTETTEDPTETTEDPTEQPPETTEEPTEAPAETTDTPADPTGEPAEAPADTTMAPSVQAAAVAPAANPVTVKSHAGQRPNGTWTSGNVSGYSEGDTINFRFVLEAAGPGSGTFDIRYTASASCQFFEPTFGLGNVGASPQPAIVPVGPDPSVSLGSNTADGSDRVQVVNVAFAAAGTVTGYYYLTLSDSAGDCSANGSSAIDGETGDVQVSGQQTVPVSGAITALPEITITKQIDTNNDGTPDRTAAAGEYQFCLSPAPASHPAPANCALTDGNGVAQWMNVEPGGQYSVSETQVDTNMGPYEFLSGIGTLNCTFVGETATVSVAGGRPASSAACTFVNELQRGSITVVKDAQPDGDQVFGFTATGSGVSGFSLVDDGSASNTQAFSDLVLGNYSVTEAVVAGWDLTGLVCIGGSNTTTDVGARRAAIDLQPGETVTCTFTNTAAPGSIVVDKVTDPSGSTQSFGFSTNYGGGFSLADGDTPDDSGPLLPSSAAGTYSVTEDTPPAGWTLTDVTCLGAGDRVVDNTAIDLQPGETVTCTFTNTAAPGSITVVKATDPSPDPTRSTFRFSGAVVGSIGAGGQLHSGDIRPGTYSVTELVPSGWTLGAIACDDADSTGNTANATATIVVGPGEDVTCTFTNVAGDVRMTVDKSADKSLVAADGEDVSFTFSVSNTGDVAFAITSLEDDVYGSLDGDVDCRVGAVLQSGESCDFEENFRVEPTGSSDATSRDHVNTFRACSILSSESVRAGAVRTTAVETCATASETIAFELAASATPVPDATLLPTDMLPATGVAAPRRGGTGQLLAWGLVLLLVAGTIVSSGFVIRKGRREL